MYDEYYLIGYEFSWAWDDNYYCGEDSDKRWYMSHHQLINVDGKLVNTSQNLLFSARWLNDFVNAIIVPQKRKIYRCTKGGLINLPYRQLSRIKNEQRDITKKEFNHVIQTRTQNITVTAKEGEKRLQEVLANHQVVDVIVRHLPQDLFGEQTA